MQVSRNSVLVNLETLLVSLHDIGLKVVLKSIWTRQWEFFKVVLFGILTDLVNEGFPMSDSCSKFASVVLCL